MVLYKSRSVMYTPPPPPLPSPIPHPLSNLKPKPQHTTLVKINRPLAILHRVRRLGEEHAVVARRLFVLAHAARLWLVGCLRRWWCLRCRGCEGGECQLCVLCSWEGGQGAGRTEGGCWGGHFGQYLFWKRRLGSREKGGGGERRISGGRVRMGWWLWLSQSGVGGGDC